MATNPERIPPLPDLPFDIALQVFTDISLRPPGENSSKRADNEVLALVGQSVCSTILTSILFARKPALSSEQLTRAREEWESEGSLMTWVNYHKDMMHQVRCLPGTVHSPEILIRTWHAYMGGIHMTKGYHVVDQFIRQLVDPSSEDAPPAGDPRTRPGGGPPVSPGPHGPSHPPTHKSEAHGQFTGYLNMCAAQRGHKVDFEHESSGPSHAPTWTANVLVDGEWKGQGIAASKKHANEEAAKAALLKLQW